MTTELYANLPTEAVVWLGIGEQGLSSRAIFDKLLLGKVDRKFGVAYPLDPDDFRRCELLLRQVPELRSRLGEMADLSDQWAELVPRWTEIADLIEEECGPLVWEPTRFRMRAPRAYALMCQIEGHPAATRERTQP